MKERKNNSLLQKMSYQLLKEKDESEINTPEINENPDLQNSNNFLICLQCLEFLQLL